MNPTENAVTIPADLKADLRDALDNLARGIRDPAAAKRACEEMDRLREENRQLFGEQNVAVEIIRQMRDSQ
jgi:uncharacterized protein with von Willebrand factor type A (vWA) domain